LQEIPQISNGKYNAYLKEIAVIVSIEKNLTTHVAKILLVMYSWIMEYPWR